MVHREVSYNMNQSDLKRNAYMLRASLSRRGYLRFWHSFQGTAPESGVTRTFFVEYFIINPALGGEAPILGQHPYCRKRGMKPSYVMVKAGVFPGGKDAGQEPVPDCEGVQLHSFYPVSSLKVAQQPLFMQIEDCVCSENHIAGCVEASSEEAAHRAFMTDSGKMEWDLEMHKAVACHTGVFSNAFFSPCSMLESLWHGEGIRTFYRGRVTLDGMAYEVTPEGSYGYADKHWGRNFNDPWMQFASCRLTSKRTGKESKHSVLALSSCCPRFFCFPLKCRLILQLTYMGEDFEFNFARPLLLSRCRWKIKETSKRFIWHIKAQNKNSVIKISCQCPKERMMEMLYESPDARLLPSPLWSGAGGAGSIELYRRSDGGMQLIDSLTIDDGLCMLQEQA